MNDRLKKKRKKQGLSHFRYAMKLIEFKCIFSSVLVDSKEPELVEHGELGEESQR